MTDAVEFEWDAFISHASEDKRPVVIALVEELQKYGLRVWFDEFTLNVGDSLRESIDRGLARSRFGVVVLSPSFFAKQWPQKELNGLFAREIEGRKVILPVWHDITKEDVLRHSPLLCDLIACKTGDGIPAAARALVRVIRPKALELQTSFADARRTAARVREQLKDANPHLEALVTIGSSPPDPLSSPIPPGLVGSLAQEGIRIDFVARDSEAYNKAPVSFKARFTHDALKRIEEAMRTGDKIHLGPDDFKGMSSEFLTKIGFGPEMFTGAQSAVLAPSSPLLERKFRFRVRFENGSESEEFPFIEFETVRAGTGQLEIRSVAPPLPFRLTLTLRLDTTTEQNFQATFSYLGHEIRKIYKCHRAMRFLKDGGRLDLFSLDVEERFAVLGGTHLTSVPDDADRFMDAFITTLPDVSVACKHAVIWSAHPTEEDAVHLSCLQQVITTGRIALTADDIELSITAEEYAAVQSVLEHKGGLIVNRVEPPEFATVFGTTFDVGPYRILIKVGEFQVASAHDNKATKTLRIRPSEPLVLLCDRFVQAAEAAPST